VNFFAANWPEDATGGGESRNAHVCKQRRILVEMLCGYVMQSAYRVASLGKRP
jgi:hypothetical protein